MTGRSETSLPGRYEEIYERASSIPQQSDPREVRRFAQLVDAVTPRDVLDLGCAEGRLAVALAELGHRVTAADIAQGQLDRTAAYARERGVAVDLVRCDVERGIESFSDSRFDTVMLMDVVEHFPSPCRALANIRELLRPQGELFIHTPNVATPARVIAHATRRGRLVDFSRPEALGDLHLCEFDYLSLEKTLNFVGLRVVELIPTSITLPLIHRLPLANPLGHRLAAWFPRLGDTLLVRCQRAPALDLDRQLGYWLAGIAAT